MSGARRADICGALILVDEHRRECEDISADTSPNARMHAYMRASAREQEVRVFSAVPARMTAE